MKFSFFLLLALIITIKMYAQKTVVCGRVNSAHGFIVNVYEPVNGYYNMAFVDTTTINSALINKKDSIYKAIKLDAPAFVSISFENENKEFIKSTDVLLFPGDSVNLHFNLEINNVEWVDYSGSNAAGQKLFNEINYKPYNKFTHVFNSLNKLPLNKHTFVKEINDAVAENVNRFSELKGNTPISAQFIQTMEVCFKSLFYGQVISKFIYDYPQREVLSKDERDKILSELVFQMSGTDVKINGLYNSSSYLNEYFNYLTYKKYKLKGVDELYQDDKEYISNGHKYIISKDFASVTYIEDEKMREDLWASNLLTYMEFVRKGLDESIINQYCAIFPDNKWEKLLRKQFANHSGVAKIDYKLQSPVVYVNNAKNIQHFYALLKELPPGRPIFVDCWATWCSPCIDAFAFNRPLDSLLLANNISRLYVSIDNQADNERWKTSIEKYCLGGYHVLATQELITDIKRICNIPNPEQSPIIIPRYLLIDKKGAIVIDDAISPRDFEMLKNQIIKSVL